ncbi:MAG: low-specificity L-threonine aldolase [Deltaproteobacteria bacterium]|nr:low-specificity L-threonine aldolase [Deltaproteobacteria bacterium]MBW2650942.1 low-specificity L-threonine aldolase [Deltaproteobacteria bacterium]
MKTIDLRSDTVTFPTTAMRDAIYNADFGDDVYGEDPSTNRLEKMAAEMVGKEDAILVSSGTMGNLISLLVHCRRGDEIILGDQAHIFYYEVGGMSALGGIVPHTVTNQSDGTMHLEDIEAAIRGDNIHYPRTRLICLENTHNRCNGMPITAEYTDSVRELANRYGVGIHLDGARIFNAAVALGAPVTDLTRGVDSVSFCLSKGLSAPVGSIICSSREFIAEARRIRKVLGGGMRQTGIIAAAGIVALEEMTKRLVDDHANAHRLAVGIAGISGLRVNLENVRSNILVFCLENNGLTEDDFIARLEERGVKFLSRGSCQFRMVTHHGITVQDIDLVLEILKDVVG